jgi:hypothetical protein
MVGPSSNGVVDAEVKNIFKKHGNLLRMREPAGNECEPVRTDAKAVIEHTATIDVLKRTDVQPVRTGSDLIPMDSPSWHSAEEHAAVLLDWMQGPGGRRR